MFNIIRPDDLQGSLGNAELDAFSGATLDVAKAYRDRGWTAGFPLPRNEKFPPPKGVTGGIDFVKWDRIEKLWEGKTEEDNLNLGLRLQSDDPQYDIIAIDVDHYDTKSGDDFLTELEQQLGSLDRRNHYRSTRRGQDNPSGQTFYRVPKGMKWESSVCPDVELVHMTHRYSAVWPSVKDGLQYRWLDPDGRLTTEIPSISDMPILPEAWVTYLSKGTLGKLPARAKRDSFDGNKTSQYREAVSWLRSTIPGWNEGANEGGQRRDISPSLAKVATSDKFMEALQTNGHDTMVSAVHAAIRLGAEGHVGLKLALASINKRFTDTVVGTKRRTEAQAKAEFENAVIGEAESLRSEVNSGDVVIIKADPSLALPNFSQMLVNAEAEKRPQGIPDLDSYGHNDHDYAKLFANYWGLDCLANPSGSTDREYASWSSKTGRYHFRRRIEMYDLIIPAIPMRLEFEAAQVEQWQSQVEEMIAKDQAGEDTPKPEDLETYANSLRKRANEMKRTSPQEQVLKQLHSIPEIKVDDADFDRVYGLMGLNGGKTLDTFEPELSVRPSRREDLLTMSTKAIYHPGAKHPAWDKFLDTFLPDPELRSFVQKAIGYSLVDGNPEKLAIFLHGEGDTGKSTILEACGLALGDYAASMDAIKLFGKKSGGPNSELLNNIAKRMVFMSEVGDDHHLSANVVKQITGNDTQQIRGVHSSKVINRAPSFTPYISTNTVPQIVGGDKALKNRLLVIPFRTSVKQNVSREDNIKDDKVLPAIFWWLVEGMMLYKTEGLARENWPDVVTRASGTFADEISPVHEFAAKWLDKTNEFSDRVTVAEVDMAWNTFCTTEGITAYEKTPPREVRKILKSLGYETGYTSVNGKKNTPIYRGVKLLKG